MLAPRQHLLARDDRGRALPSTWWRPLRDWPPGMRFEDVAAGTYGCTAAMCTMSRFAEPDITG